MIPGGHVHILVSAEMGLRIVVWSKKPEIDWVTILESQLTFNNDTKPKT